MILADKHKRVILWWCTEEVQGIRAELFFIASSSTRENVTVLNQQQTKEYKIRLPKKYLRSNFPSKGQNTFFEFVD